MTHSPGIGDCPMELRTEVEIHAPAARVWAVLADVARYAEWNPFIAEIEGDLSEGGELRLTFATSEGGSWRQTARLVALRPGFELRWRSQLWLPRLLDSEHFVTLSPLETGGTRLVQGEDLSGLFMRYAGQRATQIARGCVGMNQALKRRVETS